MTQPRTRALYEFGGFRLDPYQRLLFSSGTANPVPLPARVFDTLLYFVEHAGELLDKASLMTAIWRTVVVEENSLNQSVSILRRALGERPGEHRFIVTVPGRGYRFVADVKIAVSPATQAEPSASKIRSSAQPRCRSIAVLPFANLTGDPAKEYFGDAIAEELIHVLSRLPDLKVPARTSSFAYKGRNIDIRQIADDLGVDAVLEGSVRSAGDRVRITAQLVEGGTGYHAWSQSLDRQFEDLFGLQDDLASAVMMALAIDPASLPPSAPTHDLEAYHLYMQAVPLFLRPTEANLRGAIELLQRAVDRDPQFGRALSMLAMQYTLGVFSDYSIPDALAVAERAAARALELDPRDGVARDALGALSALRGDWLAAENHFRTAALLSSDPLTNGHRCIFVTTPVGHVRRSLQQAHEVFHATKGQPLGAMLLAVLHTHLGMDAEALRYADMAVALGQPRTVRPVPEIYATLALRAGRHIEAASHWIADLSPQMHAAGAAQAVESICVAWAHDPVQRPVAIEALKRVEARLPPDELDRVTWTCRRLLFWHVMVGALDHAYRLADRSLAQYRRTGIIGIWGFLWIPELAAFRRDPRFQAFVSQLGNLMEYWHQYGPPDGCELRDGKLRAD